MRTAFWAIGALAVGALFACQSSESFPPMLGGCTSMDASCNPGGGQGGGDGRSGDGGTSACSISGASQCLMCEAEQCCSLLEACQPSTNASCANILSCIDACSGAAGCAQACTTAPSAAPGTAAYNDLAACVSARCPACGQSGAGDPCAGAGTCNAGLTCNGAWCTKACTHTTDCAGLGAAGANSAGFSNGCIPGTGGSTCYAGCQSSLDCQGIPGTFCATESTIEGTTLEVCLPLRDAGGD